MRILRHLFFFTTSFFFALPALFSETVLLNGGFDKRGDSKLEPAGWQIGGTAQRKKWEGENWRLELTADSSSPNAFASQILKIPHPAPLAVTIAGLVKGREIQNLNEDQKGEAALVINFLDEEGKLIEKSRRFGGWKGTFSWRPWSAETRIGAVPRQLELRLEISGALGTVWFDEVEVLWGFPEDHHLDNFIVNEGFEYSNALSAWSVGEGQKVVYPGFESRSALSAKAGNSGKSETVQTLVFKDAGKIKRSELNFVYRLKKVQALKKEGGAKILIEFLDQNSAPLKALRFGPWTGSQDWTSFSGEVKIPQKAFKAKLRIVFENAGGSALFDDLRLTAHTGEGPLERPLEFRNDTSRWKLFEAPDSFEGPLDASSLLDPPAGRHGFLKAGEDGHFYFEDGTRARFFGINLQPPAALPSHEEAEKIAERLAQWGFNLVRLHHLDAPWAEPNLFDPNYDDTQHFSEESLDRLHYFIHQLKSRGIYVYLDLLVSRKFKKGDQVPAYIDLSKGAKLAAQFHPRLIELQKKYAGDLLTHVNPYTQARLVDEPAIALTEIINESTLCQSQKQKSKELPPVYLRELDGLWREAVKNNGGLEKGAFYAELQRKYFKEMQRFLRDLGFKGQIAGSNLAIDGRDLWTNAEMDFVDRHAYWDHPQGGYGDLVKFNNALLLKEVEPGNLSTEKKRINPILKLARHKIEGKPFVVGEWNINWPNEFRAIGPMLMAAYASFQDWDAIIQFNFEGHLMPEKIEGNFDISSKPEIFLQLPLAARLFHERHVAPAGGKKIFPIFENEFPFALGLIHGIFRHPERSEGSRDPSLPPAAQDDGKNSFVSDTKELTWNEVEGRVSIDTPYTQAVLGQAGRGEISLSDTRFRLQTPFAVLSVTGLDQKPIKESSHILIAAAARSENTETIYNATRTRLRSGGTAPILMEPVAGSVSVRTEQGLIPKVFALNSSGKRVGGIDFQKKNGFLEIPLGEGFLYEAVFES